MTSHIKTNKLMPRQEPSMGAQTLNLIIGLRNADTRLTTVCVSLLFILSHSPPILNQRGLNATQNPPRCTEDEKRELYNRLDPSGGGAGISCVDLVGFVEGAADDFGGGAFATASDTVIAASAALAVQDEQAGMGKLLRRAQATIVEAAQVLQC